jgi:hypothetical protein
MLTAKNPTGVGWFRKNPYRAGAMQRMEHLPAESRLSMGLGGRDHVSKHYSLSAVVDEWEAIYRSLLEKQYDRAPCERSVARA